MKKIALSVISLLMMGSAFAQSAAQDSSHTILISNNSSQAISVVDGGGYCMGHSVVTPMIKPGQSNVPAFNVNARFGCLSKAHHQFEIVDQNNNSLGYILVNRSDETFSTQVTGSPPGATPSKTLTLNPTGDEWRFEVANK